MIRLLPAAVFMTAAVLFSQQAGFVDPVVRGPGIAWFSLGETRQEVATALGRPKLTAAFGTDFEGWQFQIGDTEEGEFSHHAVFRKSDGKLISIARDYGKPVSTEPLFPAKESKVYATDSGWRVMLRRLDGDRFLLAAGLTGRNETTQIVLLNSAALRAFHQWLAVQAGI